MPAPELTFHQSQYHFSDEQERAFVLIRERLQDTYKYSLTIDKQVVCEKMHEELKCLRGILPQNLKGASWIQSVIQEMMG